MFKIEIKTPVRRHWSRSGVFIVNFEYCFTPFPRVAIVDLEQVSVNRDQFNQAVVLENLILRNFEKYFEESINSLKNKDDVLWYLTQKS